MLFTIRDLENLSGIKAHTIRIWEQRYNFLKPQRTGTNIRNYANDELKIILNVALLNKFGYKISQIDKMDADEVSQTILSLTQTEAQQERVVIELLKNMVDVDMASFEKNLETYIQSRGIEKAITNIIFPFLEKLGVLWQTSHIIPAQEHIVSNIIRRKLCVGIESITTSLKFNTSVCCFLPEGEFHELGLLFMHFLFKSRGIDVIYLGASVPVQDLEYIINHTEPDFIYTHLTTMGHNFNFEKLMNTLLKKFPDTEIILTGNMASNYEKKIPKKFFFKRSPYDVLEHVSSAASL